MREFSLEARGISKRYDVVDALASVDIAVRPGEVHGLLGPNGAGKTTLLRVLLRLARRDAGTIRMLGVDLNPDAPLPDSTAGFVETPSFYPYLSGRANLALLDRLDGSPASTRHERIASVLKQVNLDPYAEVLAGRYSAGTRQRLGLAATLLRRPQLLLLDEPTSAVDPAGAQVIRAVLEALAQEGAAILFSSHDLESVEEVCRTVSILDHGNVIFSGAIDDLRAVAPPVHILRTSDNTRALRIAAQVRDVRVEREDHDALLVCGDGQALDAYVIRLGSQGVAVRHLECRSRSLESLFLDVTAGATADSKVHPVGGTLQPFSVRGS
jgi:ABC-2 type transport system ATP-binding protein